MIYQTLQEETKARPRRRVEIVNLGLEPWEAIEMGLEAEQVSRDRRAPVADYVSRVPGRDWPNWLQSNRIELNAMTTPQLLEWLDAKMEAHGGGKVIPPDDVAELDLKDRLTQHIRRQITAKILREVQVEEQVTDALSAIAIPSSEEIVEAIEDGLAEDPVRHWTDCVADIAADLAFIGAQP
jgi:hypothetical protein